VELLRIQKNPIQLSEGFYLSRELIAYALSDDLTAVKRTINSIRTMAERYRAWVPTLHYAKGEFAVTIRAL
jgi:hypothetical protein